MADPQMGPITSGGPGTFGAAGMYLPGAAAQTASPGAGIAPPTSSPQLPPPTGPAVSDQALPVSLVPAAAPGPSTTPVPIPAHPKVDQFLAEAQQYRQDVQAYWAGNSMGTGRIREIDNQIQSIEKVLQGDTSFSAINKCKDAIRGILHGQYEFVRLKGNSQYGRNSQGERNQQYVFEDSVVQDLSQEIHAVLEATQQENTRRAAVFQEQQLQERYNALHQDLPVGLLDAFGERVKLTEPSGERTYWKLQVGTMTAAVAKSQTGEYVFAELPVNGLQPGQTLNWQQVPPPSNAPAENANPSREILLGLLRAVNGVKDVPTEQVERLEQLEQLRQDRERQNGRWRTSETSFQTFLELFQPRALHANLFEVTWGPKTIQFSRSTPDAGKLQWKFKEDSAWQPQGALPFAADTTNAGEQSINARLRLIGLAADKDEHLQSGGFEREALALAKEGKITEAVQSLDTSADKLLRQVIGSVRQDDGTYMKRYGQLELQFRKNSAGMWEWRQSQPDAAQAWTNPSIHYDRGVNLTVPSTFAFANRVLFFLERINQATSAIGQPPSSPTAP